MGMLIDLSNSTSAAFTAVGEEMQNLRDASATLNPASFGAKGDGATNDNAAWLAAAQAAILTGLEIDGLSRTYGVSELQLPVGIRIKNARFIELNPDALTDRKTLKAGGGTIYLTNVSVNKNGSTGLGGSGGAGIWFENMDGCRFENVEVFGNGKGNGIVFVDSVRMDIIRPYVHDMRFDGTGVSDDIMQGIWIIRGTDWTITNPRIERLGKINQTDVDRDNYTRGISISGTQRGTILDPHIFRVAQAIDVSGSYDNQNITVVGGTIRHVLSNGVKFANSTVGCTAIGTIVEHAGAFPFGSDCPSETQFNPGRDNQFIGCKARNAGSNNIGSNVMGFAIVARIAYPNYPKGVQFNGCMAISDVGSATFTVAGATSLQLNTATPMSLSQGVRVRLTTTGALPSPFATNTDYWLVKPTGINSGVVGLAATYNDAVDGQSIGSISGGSGTHTLTLQQNMRYGAGVYILPPATGTGSDPLAPVDITNFRASGYTIAKTFGISVPFSDVRRQSTSVSIPNNTWTAVAPDVLVYDPLTLSAVGSSQPEFTANESGLWNFEATLNFTANATGVRKERISVDTGSGFSAVPGFAIAQNAVTGGEDTAMRLTWTGFLAAGHKVRAEALQTSGGALNLTAARFQFYPASDKSGGV